MLVLSRVQDEVIVIGDDVEITVVAIRGDKVRIGVNAPKSVSVHRKEVYAAIRRENREAAAVKPGWAVFSKANPNTRLGTVYALTRIAATAEAAKVWPGGGFTLDRIEATAPTNVDAQGKGVGE